MPGPMSATARPGARWFATPLDADAAKSRADQLAALSDPGRLRVLSAVATGPGGVGDARTISSELGSPPEEVIRDLAVLAAHGLVTQVEGRPGVFTPTAETWIRFGRLVSTPQDGEPDGPQVGGQAQQEPVDPMPTAIQRIADRLSYRFSSIFSPETVSSYVAESHRLLAERAHVSQHLAVLTERFAEERLGALATASGHDRRGVPEVLFVCVSNAGRSQMAAAMLRQMAGDRIHIRTAGSRPSGRHMDPIVLRALEEVGAPVVAEFPKPLTDEVVQAADFVITMGCGDACPIYSGRRYMDWLVEDPVGHSLDDVRGIRDQIADRLVNLCQEIGVPVRRPGAP